jgi:Domain of unknown function (DUF1841)
MHGTYQGIDLELLNRDDEDDRTLLIEALHSELEDALDSGDEVTVEGGEPFNPRLHITMHQVIANQLMADDPPETWQTVQRLIGLGYDWHNIMHMISGVVSEDIYHALTQRPPADPRSYAQRLNDLPGDWPSPEELGLR